MTAVERRLELVCNALKRIFPHLKFPINDEEAAEYRFYKYSEYFPTRGGRAKENERAERMPRKDMYGIMVCKEAQWEEMFHDVECEDDETLTAYERYVTSILPLDELVPDEEFLRHYAVDEDHAFHRFVTHRAEKEGAVFGDTALRHWVALLIEISLKMKHVPLGLRVLAKFVKEWGSPLRQNTRDLAKVEDCTLNYMNALFVEMCIAESLSELNILMRCVEEGVHTVEMYGRRFRLYEIVREFFQAITPHPKKINNMLRAAYTWFVKNWGTASEEMTVLRSRASDDRNAKDVAYIEYAREKNPWAKMIQHSTFFRRSLDANMKRVEESLEYANELSDVQADMPLFKHLLKNTYRMEFEPRNIAHVLLASYLLSIQTIAGYGRAWVKNKSDDPEKILKEAPDNLVRRLREKTRDNLLRLYREAKAHGHTIVQPEDMYTSLLRLAKNTSSGVSVDVDIRRVYGPRAERKISFETISSRQKALVVFLMGDKIYSKENMTKTYDSVKSYQTKGSRDVPIKSTRTVYSIHIGILAPQMIFALPLNEYVTEVGGRTTRDVKSLGSKMIVGDLEATGSRVVDAADTFRNSGDLSVLTLAIDYADYDQHMSEENFRNGMLEALYQIAEENKHLDYEGWTTKDMVQAGWGKGRIVRSKWLGNRGVFVASKDSYDRLDEQYKKPEAGTPLARVLPGTYPITKKEKIVDAKPGEEKILLVATDGSDLAEITTHLSGEATTLAVNSVHNAGIGETIIEQVEEELPGIFEVLSEQYVGDDTLMYLRCHTRDAKKFDRLVHVIMETIRRCGHEASESKTTFLPGSCEKTQTHAKQGIYIPQDRMMMISSERRKDIENVQGYMRAQITTYVTKVSRGFSEELAHLILMFKSSLIGYRKMKRTIFDGEFRNRRFFTLEDGMTLVRVRHPLTLYIPVAWNGYGANPIALNIVMTPELFADMYTMEAYREEMRELMHIAGRVPPQWDETNADTKQIGTETPMGLYTKLTRPAVRVALTDANLRARIEEMPLQGFGPGQLSKTMMRQAVLKESRARVLLSSGYEEDYQKTLNEWRAGRMNIQVVGRNREITSAYTKLFEVHLKESRPQRRYVHPDVNLSGPFLQQKTILGNRTMRRTRMSYIERIDSILRGDVVMRGFITSNHIINVLEDFGTNHAVEDMSTIFQLMNITPQVATRLANYVCSDRATFDTLMLSKGGIAGDEFSMSLNVLTDEQWNEIVEAPRGLMKVEMDAVALHVAQLMMLRASSGVKIDKVSIICPEIHKHRVRNARVRARTMSKKTLSAICGTLRRLSTAIVQHQ